MTMTFSALVGVVLAAGGGFDSASQGTAGPATPTVELAIGEPLPEVSGVDDQGQPWKLREHTGKKVLVLYFYPGDFTGGCIKQAEAFREGLAKLVASGIEVVGVSGDSAETHHLFKQTFGLTHALVSDADGAMAKLLGMPVSRGAKVRTRGPDAKPLMDERGKSIFVERNVTLPRWTLIIGRDGKLVAKRTKVDPKTDAEEVLKIVEALPAK